MRKIKQSDSEQESIISQLNSLNKSNHSWHNISVWKQKRNAQFTFTKKDQVIKIYRRKPGWETVQEWCDEEGYVFAEMYSMNV